MFQPDICIYHGNCADGFGAAWAVWRRWGDAVQFLPGIYGETPPDVTGKRVLMVDFSYKYDVLVEMSFKARSLVVLDHHKTAQADLARLPQFDGTDLGLQSMFQMCWSQNMPEVGTQFDMERSGAQLAWDFCFPDKAERSKLIDYVADRDLWRFHLPHSREIAAWVFSHPYNFDTWHDLANALAHDLPSCAAEGAAIERKHHKDIAELLDITTRHMVIGGHLVPVANLPYTMASDAAGKLAQGAAFAACYFDKPGSRVFSLRSRGDGMDVSEIAKAYGGGGHKNAAGFQAPAGWEGDRVS